MIKPYIMALTGHRPKTNADYNVHSPYNQRLASVLDDVLQKELTKHPLVKGLSGMALGADTVWAMRLAIAAQTNHQPVLLSAQIPCAEQSSPWPDESKRLYQKILNYANEQIIYTDHYYPGCMQVRNRGMVDQADVLIAVYDGHSHGGTYNTIQYAKSVNRPIIWINSETLTVTRNGLLS